MKRPGSIIFSLAVALLLANSAALPSALGLGSSPATMQVDLRPAQVPITTTLNSMVFVATVTSGGQPVANATVSFHDSFQSDFLHPTVTTNSSGVAITEMILINPNPKNDTITADATATGYDPAQGTTVVYVFELSNQQLAVTAAVVNENSSGGSTEVIQGQVGTVYSSSTKWNGFIIGIPDCSVTFSDLLGSSFPSKTVTTNEAGFYSANFTLGDPSTALTDIVAVNATSPYYNGSVSTIEVPVNAYGPRSLTVTLDSLYPSTFSTILDYATVQARVTAGGSPVAGVPVTFSDSLGDIFVDEVGTTDSSGTATATVYYAYQATGVDVFTASASEPGFSPGTGSNILGVRPNEKTQLSVSVQLSSSTAAPGATDTISGAVGWVSGSTFYGWSPQQYPVAGAEVTISDSLKSFAPITVYANGAGIFSASFTVPSMVNRTDVIEASALDTGYKGSASSTFVSISKPQDPNGTQSSVTSSASAVASSASTVTAVASAPSVSSTSLANPSPRSSEEPVALLATVGLAVVTLLVYRLASARREGRLDSERKTGAP